eukprot:767486-Prymnesium_polylepis.1
MRVGDPSRLGVWRPDRATVASGLATSEFTSRTCTHRPLRGPRSHTSRTRLSDSLCSSTVGFSQCAAREYSSTGG